MLLSLVQLKNLKTDFKVYLSSLEEEEEGVWVCFDAAMEAQTNIIHLSDFDFLSVAFDRCVRKEKSAKDEQSFKKS